MQSTLTPETEELDFQDEIMPVPSGRRMRRRARATLAWAVAGFILCQIGLRVGIDFWLPELRDPVFETKARHLSRIIAQSPQPPVTVFMMGSSITESAFKAKSLEDLLAGELHRPTAVFNLGRPGGGPMCDLVWARRLFDRGIRPTYLLIEISPWLFNSTDKPVDMHLFPVSFLEEKDVPIIERYGLDSELSRKWWETRLVPSYGHRLTMLSYLAQDLVPHVDRVGSGGTHDGRFWQAPPPESQAERERKVAARIKHLEPSFKQFATGKSSLHALDELCQLLKQEKVPAALVLMPKGTALRQLYHAENLRQFIETVRLLSHQYDFPFVDAFTWLSDDMYSDGFHFNTEGAEAFSKKLAAEFLVPEMVRRVGKSQ